MLDIEILRIYCDLVELRSFSKTAEKHIVSQSAISQQLAKLETAHKCQFVLRQKRPFDLTPAGQLFYDSCKDMLIRYEQFKSDLMELQKASTDKINLAAIFSIGMHSLPPYLKKFMSRYPNVNVHVDYCNSSEIRELVLQGSVDIGLVAVPSRDRNLEVYEFEAEPLVVVCSPEHSLAREDTVNIEQLPLHKFIAFEKKVPTRELIDRLLAQSEVTLRPIMEFDNIETVKRAVEINSGISILPRPAILQELANGTLKAISFADANFVRPTGIIVRKHKVLNKPARYLLELLQNRWV
ncbi:MAG: LysR family transcriptional regulator [Sedimentisphaerales bacterium]|nr:LysR family transcriptional regulator [Sedimentisphaerales bacterium]